MKNDILINVVYTGRYCLVFVFVIYLTRSIFIKNNKEESEFETPKEKNG